MFPCSKLMLEPHGKFLESEPLLPRTPPPNHRKTVSNFKLKMSTETDIWQSHYQPDILCHTHSFEICSLCEKFVSVIFSENDVSQNMNIDVSVHVKTQTQRDISLMVNVAKCGVCQCGPGAKTTCPLVSGRWIDLKQFWSQTWDGRLVTSDDMLTPNTSTLAVELWIMDHYIHQYV